MSLFEIFNQAPWMEHGVCAQTDPEAFFPEPGETGIGAKRVCLGCPVRTECLDHALANDERFGIWGGLTALQRRRIQRSTVGGAA
ncbi:WhiB family transcriptional regulator [Rhodococcus rhodnii]|uniref:Transcriptional regulator WhiB n=2 Tax=Rhodococcus rhodnii TaxID=38312 RepID=R7WRJ2_9NOCA|nr:WhiB family transcriptional regulator [Rhodococcus rhodnii]EOM77933.1 transcriptional regulator [Rhodococcus rhodnii LMG 5362]TXG90290.1 WhiB family transcriptional regulator [Rhodococcus rhodnii]